MKKFLPTKQLTFDNGQWTKKCQISNLKCQMSNGFTLVELLVVVSIIAILTVIGIAIFINVSGKARDARRKADINAIASAYEANYNQETGAYRVLTADHFTGGKIPTPPEGSTPGYRYAAGPNATPRGYLTFKVCAALEGGTASCSTTGTTCYCVSAAQGVSSTSPTVPCDTTTSSITAGSSCKALTLGGPAIPPTVPPTSVYFCPRRSLDCTAASPVDDTVLYNGNYYGEDSGGTPIQRVDGTGPAAINIYKANTTVGSVVAVTAILRTSDP